MLIIIGVILLKGFVPEIALIFIIAGVVVAAAGFFCRRLSCCSGRDDLNLMKTKSSNDRDLSRCRNMRKSYSTYSILPTGLGKNNQFMKSKF